MTKGFAIICMLVLHLFCRTGSNVFGTPILWINGTIPVVYIFGFIAEICVPLYSLCAGYAHRLIFEKSRANLKNNLKRVLNLLTNYWIILVLFSIIGLFFDPEKKIPGSLIDFLKSIVLLHSYNGAWWYLNTYILLLLIPYKILFSPVEKLKPKYGLALCLLLSVFVYAFSRFDIVGLFHINNSAVTFLIKEAVNLVRILPSAWAGAILCKSKVLNKIKCFLEGYLPSRFYNMILLGIWFFVFALVFVLQKAVVFDFVGVVSFIIFNMLNKCKAVKAIFMFLGKHSTNIWLTHMFYYSCLFKNLVTIVKYPLFMLLFMLLLCIVTSYLIMGINRILNNLILRFLKKFNKNYYQFAKNHRLNRWFKFI